MLALLLATLVGADNPKTELKKLEGDWMIRSMGFDGQSYDKDQVNRRIKIEGDRITYFQGDSKMFTMKVTHFDPSARPGEIDLTRDRDDQTIRGIYKQEGDTLTICTASRGGRPTDFTARAGSPNLLNIYERTEP